MIQVTPQMRILVAVEPVDFRRGIDGLSRHCREALGAEPMSGALFVFLSRSAKALRVLAYDGQGFWLCQKRLSSGRFRHWPESTRAGSRSRSLLAHELQVLLVGGDPLSAKAPAQWRRVSPES